MNCHHSQLVLNLIATVCASEFPEGLASRSVSFKSVVVDPLWSLSELLPLSCHNRTSHLSCYATLNKIIMHSKNAIDFPSQLKPAGLDWGQSKRLDSMTTSSFHCGRPLIWIPHTVAPFLVTTRVCSTTSPGSVAHLVEKSKLSK